jgi:hypothetical protein
MPPDPVPGYPPEIESLFDGLWQQVCGFSAKWQLYLDLFAREEDRAVINETAPGAFSLIESALRNDMVMTIGRLTDPHISNGKSNLSLERLVRDLKPHCPPDLHFRLESDLSEIRKHVAPFKGLRNKRVGHNDLNTALSSKPDPALAVSRPHVDQALTMIAGLMNSISRHFADAESKFDRVAMHGNGEHLVFYLRAAVEKFEEEKRQALARCGISRA